MGVIWTERLQFKTTTLFNSIRRYSGHKLEIISCTEIYDKISKKETSYPIASYAVGIV